MSLECLWIVITFQEQNWTNNVQKLAEEDRNRIDHRITNEFIQGVTFRDVHGGSITTAAWEIFFPGHCKMPEFAQNVSVPKCSTLRLKEFH